MVAPTPPNPLAAGAARVRIFRNVALMLIVFAVGVGVIAHYYHKNQALEPVWAEGDQAVEWGRERLPLKVWMDDELHDGYAKSYVQAINDFNRDAGCPIFAVSSDREFSDVDILSLGTEGSSEVAGSWIKRTPALHGEVHISKPGTSTEMYLIIYHELGHETGLAHDGFVTPPPPPPAGPPSDEVRSTQGPMSLSIMTNNVVEHASRIDQGESMPKLSVRDAAALKQRYCDPVKR